MSILQRCCTSHIIKICYIFCAVTFTISFIVGGFLVHLLMLPYLHESDFKPGICQVNSIKLVNSQPWPGPGGGGRLKCENKCSKERSAFPCLKVSIFFEKDGHNRTGILFDTIMTHQSYRQYGCVTSSCHHRQDENDLAVKRFRENLIRRRVFRCFVSADHGTEALMYKIYKPITIFNAVFWPYGICVASAIALLCLYRLDKCRIWKADELLITLNK